MVHYDFTRGKIREVHPYVPNARTKEIDVEEPGIVAVSDEDDDSDILASGILELSEPCYEGLWEFWDSGSGILELSIPHFGDFGCSEVPAI